MGVLYVNKPKGITSFDVCYKLRRVLGTRKIGHTGTLDPNATGVMIVLFNEATKANQFLVSDIKEYIGTCLIGVETDSLDIDGNVLKQEVVNMPSLNEIADVFKSFVGSYKQIPPMASAIKINGKKLYEYQREGKEVKVEARDVSIYELELLDVSSNQFTFRCLVSSGTYVRSLLKDVLDKLNIIGTLKELQRTKINDICLDDCDNLDDIVNGNFHVHELYEVLSKKYYVYNTDSIKDVINGKPLILDLNEETILFVSNKKCLAIYRKEKDRYTCVRGLL